MSFIAAVLVAVASCSTGAGADSTSSPASATGEHSHDHSNGDGHVSLPVGDGTTASEVGYTLRDVRLPIFVLQCGDPTGTGSGDPGYGYGVENAPADFQYPRGTLAMARTQDPNTNGGQFFIVFDQTELPDPNGYSIFGRVTEGMDIVDRIAEQGVGGTLGPAAPKQPISILSVDVEKAS
jgi:cyclophilin family peptidyl-prolyl cis-trans isomerase